MNFCANNAEGGFLECGIPQQGCVDDDMSGASNSILANTNTKVLAQNKHCGVIVDEFKASLERRMDGQQHAQRLTLKGSDDTEESTSRDDTTYRRQQQEGIDVEDLTILRDSVPTFDDYNEKKCRFPCSKKFLVVLLALLLAGLVVMTVAFILNVQGSNETGGMMMPSSADELWEPRPVDTTVATDVQDCLIDADCASGVCSGGVCSVAKLSSDDSLSTSEAAQTLDDDWMETLKTVAPTTVPEVPCSQDGDCSAGRCVLSGLNTTSTPSDGVCSDGLIGSICGTSTDCDSSRCIKGQCKAKQTIAGSCKGHEECDSGVCGGFSAVNMGLCLDTSPENVCDVNDLSDPCGTHGTCVEGFCKSFRLASGEVCTENSDCVSGDCTWSQIYVDKRCD